MAFINLNEDNLDQEHICCAIADKKHQCGVGLKKEWLRPQLSKGHVFRKLDEKGKVFIEYVPIEQAWTPVDGSNYLFIYCLWVAGKYKGMGYGKELLQYCIDDAKAQGKSGVCVLSSAKKKPYLSDGRFFKANGFETVDTIGDGYELLALSFDESTPCFSECARKQQIADEKLTIYYSVQCPFIANCIEQVEQYCEANEILLKLVKVDTLEKARSVPGVFNNWAVFWQGRFQTVQLQNEGSLKKLLAQMGGK